MGSLLEHVTEAFDHQQSRIERGHRLTECLQKRRGAVPHSSTQANVVKQEEARITTAAKPNNFASAIAYLGKTYDTWTAFPELSSAKRHVAQHLARWVVVPKKNMYF